MSLSEASIGTILANEIERVYQNPETLLSEAWLEGTHMEHPGQRVFDARGVTGPSMVRITSDVSERAISIMSARDPRCTQEIALGIEGESKKLFVRDARILNPALLPNPLQCVKLTSLARYFADQASANLEEVVTSEAYRVLEEGKGSHVERFSTTTAAQSFRGEDYCVFRFKRSCGDSDYVHHSRYRSMLRGFPDGSEGENAVRGCYKISTSSGKNRVFNFIPFLRNADVETIMTILRDFIFVAST